MSYHSAQVPELPTSFATYWHSLMEDPMRIELLRQELSSSVSLSGDELHFPPRPLCSATQLPPKYVLAPFLRLTLTTSAATLSGATY